MMIAAILGSSSPDGPLLDNLAFDHVCAFMWCPSLSLGRASCDEG
jgi:hypothetical protein